MLFKDPDPDLNPNEEINFKSGSAKVVIAGFDCTLTLAIYVFASSQKKYFDFVLLFCQKMFVKWFA